MYEVYDLTNESLLDMKGGRGEDGLSIKTRVVHLMKIQMNLCIFMIFFRN